MIDVDLNDANPVVVIEAKLTDLPVLVEVNISKTGSYFGSEPATKISNASVILENNFGGRFLLKEVEEGFVLTCQSRPLTKKVVVSFDEY